MLFIPRLTEWFALPQYRKASQVYPIAESDVFRFLVVTLRSSGRRHLRDGCRPENPVITGMFFRHSEFSAAEIEAVRRLVGHSIAAVERELICATLTQGGGNRTHAATVLGISIRALRNKIRAYRSRGWGVPEPNLPFRPIPDARSGI